MCVRFVIAMPTEKTSEDGEDVKRTRLRTMALIIGAFSGATIAGAWEFKTIGAVTPTIAAAIDSTAAANWIGTSYAIGEMALAPLSCNLAFILGRRVTFVGAFILGRSVTFVGYIALFIIGSAICSAARNGPTLLAGRALAGAGHGGVFALPEVRP